jgi:hypothetical protein
MNIPLDSLYHWIRGCATDLVSIYIFTPHGSKNIKNLHYLGPEDNSIISPEIVCHDQEPLDYNAYKNVDITKFWAKPFSKHKITLKRKIILSRIIIDQGENGLFLNFYTMLRSIKFETIFDSYVLLHSEKNSQDVENFSKSAAVPAFYWSHAVIARDWYRFAEHDTRLLQQQKKDKTFLVYLRAWTGTREYRLKFAELLIEKKLLEHCQISIMHQDSNLNLKSYVCNNPKFQPVNQNQLFDLPDNQNLSCASADYDAKDYTSTNISVVLETVAADTKIHLTEKILRPIACGHPFLLIAGPGSLEFLRSYGFKTFSPWINESYDLENDVLKRMELVADEMKKIKNLPLNKQTYLMSELKKIANYNKNYFFSNKFFNTVQLELVANLNSAILKVKKTQGNFYKLFQESTQNLNTDYIDSKEVEIVKILEKLKIDSSINIRDIVSQYPSGFFNP